MDRITFRRVLKGLRTHLLALGGLFLGLAVASILKVNNPEDKLLIAGYFAMPLFLVGIVADIWDSIKDTRQRWQEQDAEWDRLIKEGIRNPDAKPEPN
jgi:hypothetical protein